MVQENRRAGARHLHTLRRMNDLNEGERLVSDHTPGPWIAEGWCSGKSPDAGCGVVASHDERKISNPSRGIVAWATRHVGQTSIEVEANARLIAAAPDLLAALEAVMDEWREGYGLRCEKQVRAAIAKATGQ